ncbi:hypothetical protein [Novosphingobium sp.]|uniref:hypothetical protein n=1 Tax=Novosphingobium sp. TaxID=1874826 RepID=UPI003B52708F
MGNLTFIGGALSADQTSILITGTDEPSDVGMQIQIFDNSVQVATATVDSSGDWTATVATSASGADVYTAQFTANGNVNDSNGLVVERSASATFDGYNPVAQLTGSGDVLSIASPNAIVTAGGNGQNATTTDLIQQFFTSAHIYRLNPNTLTVLDNSRVDVWMDFFTATLGNNDNYGVAGYVESVVVNGAGDNVWIAKNEEDSITSVNGWNSIDLHVTVLDGTRANVEGNAISVAIGNSDNCGTYGTGNTIAAHGIGDGVWAGGNGQDAAITDFVDGTGSTGLVVTELNGSRIDVTGDGVTAYLGFSQDNFGIYGSAETVIAAPGPISSQTLYNINIWIGGNGQNAAVTDQAYVGAPNSLTSNLTVLDNSRVDVSGWDVATTIGNNDNFGAYGLVQSVVATGTGDNIWIGGNGVNAAAADTVTLQHGGNVTLLDSSWVSVAGQGAAVQLGVGDTLNLSGTGEAVTFGQQIGSATLAGFDTSDQVTLQKSSFGSQAAGFDYWAYLMGHATAAGGDTTITLDANDSIVLKGVTLSAANQSQFHFA